MKEFWFGDMPKVSRKKAIACLIMNILCPGSGTIYLGCTQDPKNKKLITKGIYQFITFLLVIGFLWSVFYGIELLKQSYKEEEEKAKKKVEDVKEPLIKAKADVENAKDKVEEKTKNKDTATEDVLETNKLEHSGPGGIVETVNDKVEDTTKEKTEATIEVKAEL